MKCVFLVLALVAVCVMARPVSDSELLRAFSGFQNRYNKFYDSKAETMKRFAIFADVYRYVNEFDSEVAGFTVGLNEFADRTRAELAGMRGYTGSFQERSGNVADFSGVRDIPTSIDWRTDGIVTPVKNQGQCGSCWSFSSTGSMEGAHAQSTGNLVSLSEQNLIDCSTAEGNMGCNGGLMDYAFEYVISNNGIDTEASYPYTATGPNRCEFNPSNVGATISSYTDITSGSESDLTTAIGTVRPVSVAIDASHMSFQFYNGGVYYEPACSSTQLDHGVLTVGYGAQGSSDYYIVKNSWGASWGLNGYILMSRNRDNNCGIATAASYPSV